MKKILWTLAVIAMAALSCTKQENGGEINPEIDGPDDVTYLKINSVTTSELVKSAIKDTKFPTDEEVSIGLFVVGDAYADEKYSNIKCTKPAGSDEFNTPLIELKEDKATVYAYYPYDGNIAKNPDAIKAIQVESSVGGDDWMWTTPITEVCTAKSAIDLKFNHALALVEITFNVYGPEATMTNVTLAGSDDGTFSKAGTMNATDGAITSDSAQTATKTSPFSQEVSLPLTDGKIVADCLLVPCKTGTDADTRQDFYIKCTYNGKTYSVSLTGDKGVIVRKNTKSTIVLNIKDNKLEVVSVGVASWTDTNVSGNTATVGGHTVTFNCPEGLKYELYTEFVSTALPDEETDAGAARTVILRYDKASIPDGRFVFNGSISGCAFVHDELSGIITVKDVTKDVTVNLGFGTYIKYTASEKVIPNKTDAFGFPYDEARSTFNGSNGVIAIDGIVTSIGKNAFASNKKLTSVTIPEGVVEIGESAFTECTNLVFPQFPESLKTIGKSAFKKAGTGIYSETVALAFGSKLQTIGESAFTGCSRLTSVSFPSGLATIGNNAFENCIRLTNINLETCTNLTAIGDLAFFGAGSDAGCSPFSLVLPEGLVEIGAGAFNGSKISSVTLPSTLSIIGNNAFYRCGSLKTITSKAGNPPTLGTYVFYDFDMSTSKEVPLKSIEDIFVPDTSVDTYKAADGWSDFSGKISANPTQN
ncbi:MAG: leucine-rich repeat protein [Bacteroidales bacterium]|nr:leucine-rich repeat protein [Bacteroidales bacterium]